MRTYNMILKGIDALDFPRHISKHAQTLIKKLCRCACNRASTIAPPHCRDTPAERLGCQRGGMREVRKTRWFDGFDFHALREGHLIAPYVPEVRISV